MPSGQTGQILEFIVVGILGFAFLLVAWRFNILGIQEQGGKLLAGVQLAFSNFLVPKTCTGFVDACERWLAGGLGLPSTFEEADISDAADSCGVKECVIPEDSKKTRTTTRDCLRTAVIVINIRDSACIHDYVELGYNDPTTCVQEELAEILPGG